MRDESIWGPTDPAVDWAMMSGDQKRAFIARRERNKAAGRPLDAPDPAPDLTPEQHAIQERLETAHWKAEQRECRKVFIACGCTVYWLSQSRRTQQTPGLGDLWVFGPEGTAIAFWWETKSGTGDLSDAQRTFRDLCVRQHVRHGSGDRWAARRFAAELGLARYDGESFEPITRPQ